MPVPINRYDIPSIFRRAKGRNPSAEEFAQIEKDVRNIPSDADAVSYIERFNMTMPGSEVLERQVREHKALKRNEVEAYLQRMGRPKNDFTGVEQLGDDLYDVSGVPTGGIERTIRDESGVTTPTPVDEDAIRRQQQEQLKSQLDAIEAIFKPIEAMQAQAAANRSGGTRAANSAGGLIGSPFGTADTAKTETENAAAAAQTAALKAERVQAAMTGAQTRADDEILRKVKANEEAADKHTAHLEKLKTQARDDLATFAAGGGSLEDLNNAEYRRLFEDSGFGSVAEFEAYINAKKPKAQQVKYTYETLKNGQVLRMGDDGSTKVVNDIQLPTDGNYEIRQFDNGEVVIFDADTGTTKPLGNYAKPKTGSGGSSGGTVKLSTAQRAKLLRVFSNSELRDFETAVNDYGLDEVLTTVEDPQERAAIQDAFGISTETESLDDRLKALGYDAEAIREYKTAQTDNPNQTLDPVGFLKRFKEQKAAAKGGSSDEALLNQFLGVE
ncbi:MAG: hypothetical protein PHI63_04785 [Patescibacteria group bacterium]|nr:hypothetical protein [Patescibacteria group bacterium]